MFFFRIFCIRWRLHGVDSEHTAHRSRDDKFLVGADDAHLHPATVSRDHPGVLLIAMRVKFDVEKSKARANARANQRRFFSDAAGTN